MTFSWTFTHLAEAFMQNFHSLLDYILSEGHTLNEEDVRPKHQVNAFLNEVLIFKTSRLRKYKSMFGVILHNSPHI